MTGTVLFTPQSKSGMVSQTRETYDNLGRRVVVPTRVFMERKGYILRPKFIFIDGRTGTRIYSESFREERLYPSQQNVPALSSYFELMDDVIPRFLNVLQHAEGPRHARPPQVARARRRARSPSPHSTAARRFTPSRMSATRIRE